MPADEEGPGAPGPTRTRRARLRSVLVGIAGLVAVTLIGVVAWASIARPPEPEPLAAVLADPAIEVARGQVVELRPAGTDVDRGVVFYPGARVHPEAYIATWAPIVVATDTLVLIPRMPLNLAVLGRSRAADLIEDTAGIGTWWVGGHSLGGAMAASWVGEQEPGSVDGLTLWASFATVGAGLEERDELTVLSISGSRDGLATSAEISERRPLLPPEAIMVEVEGMNHAQFGRYGPQRGDLEAEISDDAARSALLEAHVSAFGGGAPGR